MRCLCGYTGTTGVVASEDLRPSSVAKPFIVLRCRVLASSLVIFNFALKLSRCSINHLNLDQEDRAQNISATWRK
ncbi:hypothetical protein V2G26_021017 [Clonostachys chloroleuca]